MVRSFWLAAVSACALGLWLPGNATACEGEAGGCKCQHGGEAKGEQAGAAAKKHKKAARATDKDKAKKATPANVPEPAPATQGSLLPDGDSAVSATCSCSSAADCTCKKNECKCKACEKRPNASPIIEGLRGVPLRPALPRNARMEATGGVFI